jgi:hypothetical protein
MSSELALDRPSSLAEQDVSAGRHDWSLANWMKLDKLSSCWKYWKAAE